MAKVFMGIDQSLRSTGVCIIAENHDGSLEVLHSEQVVTVRSTDCMYSDLLNTAHTILATLVPLLDQYKPYSIAVEALSLASQGKATRSLAMLMGYLLAVLTERDDYFVIMTPAALKKFATGKGNATKEAMLAAIEPMNGELFEQLTKLPKSKGKFDIADAYWLSMLAAMKE